MKKLESIRKNQFSDSELNSSSMSSVRGGLMATTKTKLTKTKEAPADSDSASDQENPKEQLEIEPIY